MGQQGSGSSSGGQDGNGGTQQGSQKDKSQLGSGSQTGDKNQNDQSSKI
jgi:hypothetical protein